MEQLKFSVSMCVYKGDNPDYFDTAVNSVLTQTIPPSEIVLVVDGPIPDKTRKIVDKYKKKLTPKVFRVIELKKNMGHGYARRASFDNCLYDYIAIMDSDDISLPNRFEKELEAFRNNKKLSIVGSHVKEFIGNDKNVISCRKVRLLDKEIKNDMRKRCPMNQPTVMFKRIDVAEVGGYRDWYCNEDYYLWIRLALKGKVFANIDESLVKMRTDKKTYERRGGWKYFLSEARIQRLLLDNKMIGVFTYIINVLKRFLVQVIMPNPFRRFIYTRFARKRVK